MKILVPSIDDLTKDDLETLRSVATAGTKVTEAPTDEWATVGAFGARGAWTGDLSESINRALEFERKSDDSLHDWHQDNLFHCDIETYSSVDLKKASVYKYAEAYDFQILMLAYAWNDEPVKVALGKEEIRQVLSDALDTTLDGKSKIVAHNANFERVCFSRFMDLPAGNFFDPDVFVDTEALCAVWGLPRSLKDAAVALGAEPKDEAGTRLINQFSKPNRKGEQNKMSDHPEDAEAFANYCAQDVDTMRDILHRLGRDFPTDTEHRIYNVDQDINDRGVHIDTAMAAGAVDCFEGNKADAKRELAEITGLANPNSVKQLSGWLESQGFPTPSLDKAHVSALLEKDLPDNVRRALTLRQEIALSAAGKYTVARDATNDDGRIRGVTKYAGAHTLRWAGRLLQLQNLPRDHYTDSDGEHDSESEQAAIDTLLEGGRIPTLDLKKLIRPLLVGPFTVCDYSAIEARVVAWLAGEQWALDAFAAGRDIYTETANQMGGVEKGMDRQRGKVAVLACIAKGTPILTDQGEVPIENVTTDMRVWDGVEWVSHEGVVYRGERKVIEYDGLTATPDHQVWVQGARGPVAFGDAAASGSRLVRSGDGRGCSEQAEELARDRGTARVYDIANAGPRHRYTAAGRLVHNCGYGGGGNALLAMGGRSIVEGSDNMTDAEVAQELYPLAEQYRRANPKIAAFWGEIEEAFGGGGGTSTGLVNVEVQGTDRYVWLPSGRPVVYHNVRRDWHQARNKAGQPVGKPKYVWHFDNPGSDRKRIPRIETYGGKLTENIVQATARDVIGDAMVRLEEDNWPIVAHVHDEVIVDRVDSGSVDTVSSIMCAPTAWNTGLPLNAEGYTCNRYRKG